MEIDHVLIAVADLDEAARTIEARHGLASAEGGRHPGWGTANRIVPLGDSYLELVSVVDEDEAAGTLFGRWVAAALAASVQPLGWAVRTDQLDEVARRLGLTVAAGSRARPDGEVVRWRLAGLEQAIAEPALPFFISWEPGTVFPGSAPVTHPAGSASIAGLELTGDPDRLTQWLGPHSLPISVRPGLATVAGVIVATSSDEVVLGAGRG